MTIDPSVLARRALLSAWLVVVWLLLWGRILPVVVISGVVAAVLAVWASRLPALPVTVRVRWRRLPGLVIRFWLDLLRSSWAVAVATLRSRQGTRSSVLEVPIPPGTSDAGLLLACNRISLEPGSLVVEVDLERGCVYVYQLDTPDRAAADRARRRAQGVLEDVAATFPARERGASERGQP